MSVETDALRAFQHENVRLRDENRSLRDELIRLRHAIRALKDLQDSLAVIDENTDVFALLNRILHRALDAVDSENGSLLLLDEEKDELLFVEVIGQHRDALMGYRLPLGVGIAGWTVANRQPELVADVRLDPRFSPDIDQAIGFRTSSLICVPLIYQNRLWGAIEVVNTRSGEPFGEDDLDILLLVARLAAQVLARAERAVVSEEQQAEWGADDQAAPPDSAA